MSWNQIFLCYTMTVDMDFGFVSGDPVCCLTSCHIVISKQGDGRASGSAVELVCNRKETTWYENHTVRFRQSVQSESRVEPGIRSQSEAFVSSLTLRLARECKCWHPLLPGRRYGARRSPFSEYMSLHQSLELPTNRVPLSRIKMREIYFYKEVYFVSFIEFHESCLIISLMNP